MEPRDQALFGFDEALRRDFQSETLIGIDEAGRGPLAGPLVVAAVCLDPAAASGLQGVRDSKLLSPRKREELFNRIRLHALLVSVAWHHPPDIDRLNIFKATMAAMKRAALKILRLYSAPLIVDGPFAVRGLAVSQRAVVKGDRKSLVVASASIVAKVVRDRWMKRLDRTYPGYGFSRHKGYGTREHLEALARLGPSYAHRRSYAPVRNILEPVSGK